MRIRIIITSVFCFLFLFSFSGNKIPNPAPDYSDLKSWAAHPYIHDLSDSIPQFLVGEKRDSSVDVFFIHPTTYTVYNEKYGLNATIDDAGINHKTDYGTILFQASVFNGLCRVFAPRYRQANLKVFFSKDKQSSQEALDLAYQDVKSAFQYYLDHWNKGRPIIIASHSQGTVHAIRLLQEFFDGKPLQKQLVCAYLVGYQIKKDAFKNITIGTSPTQTGCFVGWRSFKKGFYPVRKDHEPGNSQCVNPVTWDTITDKWSAKVLHRGIVGRNFNRLLYPRATSCEIEPGLKILWVVPPVKLKRKYSVVKNYHVFDYNLFYMNIRHNVKQRVDAYLKQH